MKKIITLKRAIKLLTNCSAVIWGDGFLCYPGIIDEDETNKDNVFLELRTSDSEALDEESNFVVKDNETVTVVGSSMFLVDTNGDGKQLTLLVPQKLA
jgi:hypothetical protein